MKQAYNIPLRKTAKGEQIETRPVFIEEWLDSLPYVDFEKTTELLLDATARTNQQSLKLRTRQELIELYHRPYQYYIDSQVRTGSHHPLKGIKTFQKKIEALKGLAINLGLACQLIIDEKVNRKPTRWRNNKPPVLHMLMAMNYLSHALVFSFLKYSPAPKTIWLQLNQIYAMAESMQQQDTLIQLPGVDNDDGVTTIAQSYKRITMASLADHHHLPFGAIWEVFVQLDEWQNLVDICAFSQPEKPIAYFVIALEDDNKPTPMVKFDSGRANEHTRMLNASALGDLIQTLLGKLNHNEKTEQNLKLSPYYLKNILSYMAKSWGLPAKRYFNREPREAAVDVICGIDAVYFHFSGENEFTMPVANEETNDIVLAEINTEPDTSEERINRYHAERWQLVNEGQGGFAVIKNARPAQGIQVGDLLAISYGLTDSDPGKNWELGIIRWLMVSHDNIYRIGAQKIFAVVKPCALRAVAGSSEDKRYRRALLIGDSSKDEPLAVITSRGLFSEYRELELHLQEMKKSCYCENMIEATVGFEQFSINIK